MNNPIEDPDITFPLSKVLKFLLGEFNFEKCEIELEDAYIFAHKDPSESKIHIQFPNPENKLRRPILWRINAWRADVARRDRERRQAEKDRIERLYLKENAEKIHKIFCNMLCLPYNNMVLYEAAMKIASRKDLQAAENIGVELEFPPSSDNESSKDS